MADQYLQPFFDTLSQGVQVAQQLKQAAIQQAQFNRDDAFRNRQQDLREQEAQNALVQSGAKPVDAAGNTSYAPRPSASLSIDPSTQTPVTPGPNAVAPSAPPPTPVGGNPVMPWSPEAQTAPPPQQPPSRRLFDASTLGQPNNMGTAPDIQQTVPATGLQLDTTTAPQQGFAADKNRLLQSGSKTYEDPTWAEKLQRIKDSWDAQQYPVAPASAGRSAAPDKYEWNSKGQPVFVNPVTHEVHVGAPVPGMAQAAGGGKGGEKELTPDAQLKGANAARKEFSDWDTQEHDLRQSLDEYDHAIEMGGTHVVDKNGNVVAGINPTTKEPFTAAEIANNLDNLRMQRDAIAKKLPQVLAAKYAAGEQYAQLMTKKPANWGMPLDQAQSELQARIGSPVPSTGPTSKTKKTATAPAAPTTPAAPAAATPAAAPAPTATPAAAPKQKVATMASINAYARKYKISGEAALKEFQDNGFAITH